LTEGSNTICFSFLLHLRRVNIMLCYTTSMLYLYNKHNFAIILIALYKI
jgi:hypothetical protein